MEGLCKFIFVSFIYFQQRYVHENQAPMSTTVGHIQDLIPSVLTVLMLWGGFAESHVIHYKSFFYHTITGKILILTPYQPEMLNQLYQVC